MITSVWIKDITEHGKIYENMKYLLIDILIAYREDKIIIRGLGFPGPDGIVIVPSRLVTNKENE